MPISGRSLQALMRYPLVGICWSLACCIGIGSPTGWFTGAPGLFGAVTEGADAEKSDSQPGAPSTPSDTSTNPPGKPELSPEQQAKLRERNSLIRRVNSLQAEKKFADAIEVIGQIVEIEREVLGETNADVAESQRWLAQFQDLAGDFGAAERSYQRALEILTKIFGKDDYRVIDAGWTVKTTRIKGKLDADAQRELIRRDELNRLVGQYYQQAEYAKAVTAAAEVLKIEKNILGEEHPDYATSLNNLAELHRMMGDYTSAEPLYEKALAIKKKTLGSEHPSYATSMNNLAILYYSMGDYVRAEPLFQQSLAIRKEVFGEEHRDYASSLNNLAKLYEMIGAYGRAEPLYEKTLAIMKKALGEEHPSYATSLENLAALYYTMGNSVRAEPLYEQALAIRKKVLGEEHPDYARSLNSLAVLYASMDQYSRAEPLFQQALAIRKKVVGEQHPEYATSVANLAGLYFSMSDYTRAEPLYEQALAIRKKALGEGHPDYAMNMRFLAGLYDTMGDHVRAELLYQQSLAITKKALGEEHPEYATCSESLAGLYLSLGDFARAEPLYKQATEIRKKTLGEEHFEYAMSLHSLGFLYKSMGDYARAEPLYQQALAILKKARGEDDLSYATSLNNLAELYHTMGDLPGAKALHEQALAITEKVLGEEHPANALSLGNLAGLYKSMGDYARAEQLLLRALAIRKKALGEEHPDYALSLNNLAVLYDTMGDSARAEPLLQQALATRKKALGENHPNYAAGLNNLALLYRERGEDARAEPFAREAVDVTLRRLEKILPVLSEAQALAMLDKVLGVDFWLTIVRDLPMPDPLGAWSRIWRSRGLIEATMRQRRLAVRATPETAPLMAGLRTIQQQLAQLTLAVPRTDQREARQKRLAELNDAKESLEKRLAVVSADFRQVQGLDAAGPKELLARLPVGTVVVDLAQVAYYRRVSEGGQPGKPQTEWHYEAFVVGGKQKPEDADAKGATQQSGRAVVWVHLGPVEPIDEAVNAWREAIVQRDAPSVDEDSPEVILRRLVWAPLEEHFGSNQTIIVIPDGSLSVLPWSALPGQRPGSFVLDEYQITVASHGRQVLQLLEDRPAYQENLFVVGGVDYDHRPDEVLSALVGEDPSPSLIASVGRSGMPAVDRTKPIRWKFLRGTQAEARQIAELWKRSGAATPPSSVGTSETAFRAVAPGARFLHLATHGFFADPSHRSIFGHLSSDAPLFGGSSGAKRANVAARNPFVLTGVVLAGANLPPVTDELGLPTGEDGIFTAEEVVSLDLRGTELVVLSACETGLGEIGGGGEGVFGLQRAFHLAGSRNVVGSLWQVNDAATMVLMTEFYKNLWERKLSPAAALRRAQLVMLTAYDPETGQLRADVEAGDKDETALTHIRAEQLRNPKHAVLPPYYWSAFSFSGDWR